MADILAAVLKQYSSYSEDSQWPPLSDYKSCVVVGECDSLKRSLLFLAAVRAASELGLKVLFLSPAPIQSLPSLLQKALARLSPDNLKKIKFKYPGCSEELRCEIASLHELASEGAALPSLLIVDGMERYLETGLQTKQSYAAHISALLIDTASFLTQKLAERGDTPTPCHVIASFRSEQEGRPAEELKAPDPVLAVIDRYFPVRCTFIRGDTSSTLEYKTEKKETWQIYFSGVGITTTTTKTTDTAFGKQWSLSVSPDGAMEFSILREND